MGIRNLVSMVDNIEKYPCLDSWRNNLLMNSSVSKPILLCGTLPLGGIILITAHVPPTYDDLKL